MSLSLFFSALTALDLDTLAWDMKSSMSLPSTPVSSISRHPCIHNVVIVVLQRLNGLGSGHISLGHDKLDVLALNTGLVDLSIIFLFLGDSGVAGGSRSSHFTGCSGLGVLE